MISLAGIAAMLLTADFLVGKQEQDIIDAKEARVKKLEEQAFYMLSADIRDIRETEDIEKREIYEAVLRIDNVADESVYVSHPHVKAFVQTGSISWMEVPVADKDEGRKKQVYKIEPRGGSAVYEKLLTISHELPYNQRLMPKYMHVRFHIFLYVMPESGFREGEVVERRGSTFVFLKPYYIGEEEIREVIDFGETKVPTYIPITGFRNWDT